MAKHHRQFASLSDEQLIKFFSENYSQFNFTRRIRLAEFDQSFYVVLRKRNLLDQIFPNKGCKGRKLSEAQKKLISARSSIPTKYTPEILANLAWDYVYFDDSAEEICRNYDVPNESQLSRLTRKAITLGAITEEQYLAAYKRRLSYITTGENNGNSKLKHRGIELLARVSEEVRQHRRGERTAFTSNAELANEYGVLNVSTICRQLRKLPKSIRDYRTKMIRSQLSKAAFDLNGNPSQRVSYQEREKMLEFVIEEMARFDNGEIDCLTRNKDLGEKWGVKSGSVTKYLRKLPDELRKARQSIIQQKVLDSINSVNPNPFSKLSEDQFKEIQRRGVAASIKSLTYEQRAEIGRKGAMAARKNRFEFNGVFYDSRTEAACAAMLEKYIPGFGIEEGKTYQVNGDTPCFFDFNLEKAILEWHPITIQYEINKVISPEDYGTFLELKQGIKDSKERKEFEEWYKNELAVEYWMQRQDASDKSKIYKGKEVVLARTAGELYDEVIKKYGQNIPSKDFFYQEFYNIVGKVNSVKRSEAA